MSPPLADSDMNFNVDVDIDDSVDYEPGAFGLESQDISTALQAPTEIFAQTDGPASQGYINPTFGSLPMDLDGMSWPWLHETLFLQDDPFAGLFEDAGLQQGYARVSAPAGTINGPDLRTSDHLTPSPGADDHPVVTPDPNIILAEEVDRLVEYATKTSSETTTQAARKSHLRAASGRLRPVLITDHLHADESTDTHLMHHVILSHYIPKFNRLWPMFSRYQFDPDVLNPILYLVLVSIGSMYGSDHQKHFGTLLHMRLRRSLAASSFDLENPEGDMVWLAHARLLTQVQGLYFGQKQGFSYAQVCTAKL